MIIPISSGHTRVIVLVTHTHTHTHTWNYKFLRGGFKTRKKATVAIRRISARTGQLGVIHVILYTCHCRGRTNRKGLSGGTYDRSNAYVPTTYCFVAQSAGSHYRLVPFRLRQKDKSRRRVVVGSARAS